MPKAFLKQKNHKRIASFVSNNSKLNSETDISKNSNNILKPSFPPTLTPNDLIKNTPKSSTSNNNKPKTLPNAFIAYRMALVEEYRIKNRKLPSMGELSKIAKNSWNIEPKHVKDFYESLVRNAKSIYRQNNLQIVLDKRMNDSINYVENGQEGQHAVDSRVTYGAERNLYDECDNTSHNNDVSFPSISSTNISLINPSPTNNFYVPQYDLNSILHCQEEYIKMLEELIGFFV